jgi:F-type H+-transporting ATPase subunit epsilon
MAEPLTVEVVSPESLLYEGQATMVITRTLGGGEIAFQAGHAPFLGALTDNHTRVFLLDGTVEDTAELASQIDVERARVAKERAEAQLRHGHDAEALSALSRANARLTAAGKI